MKLEFCDRHGRLRSLEEYLAALQVNVNKRWRGRLKDDIMEEAFAFTVEHMVTDWVSYPSSRNVDGTYRWEYALLHGRSRFFRFYVREAAALTAGPQEFTELLQEFPDVELRVLDLSGGESLDWLNSLDQEQLDRVLKDFDGPAPIVGRREGISRQAVNKRRRKHRRAMKRAWSEYAKRN